MSTQKDVISTFKTYSHALYGPDWDIILEDLYPPDILQLHSVILELVALIQPYGEMKQFYSFFPGLSHSEALHKLSPADFVRFFISGSMRSVPKEAMIEWVETFSIDAVKIEGNQAKIKYSYPQSFQGESYLMEKEADLILENNRWYVRIRTGFEKVLEQFRYDIGLFKERKSRDQLQPDIPDEELEVFSWQGYRHWETSREVIAPRPDLEELEDDDLHRFFIYGYRHQQSGKTIIAPRFKKAGPFSEGLAPIRIFSQYGYINKRAELVILPEYDEAGTFSEGLAPAALFDGEDDKYGYIDTTGAFVIPTQYDEARPFQEGRAAVRQGAYWGYIDKKGKLCIDFYFVEASDYVAGRARVETDGDNAAVLWIDYKGRVIEKEM